MKKIIIVGAGPSGMMAAITAKRAGNDVVLIEHNDRVGKKILSTGNGRCNFTNIMQRPEFYHSDHPHFQENVLNQFGAQDVIAFFSELGIYTKNRNGYIYPYSDQATAILDVLRFELKRLNIELKLSEQIETIAKDKNTFFVKTNSGIYEGKSLIIATGGKAASKTGSDGSGYQYAKNFGHKIIPVVPALVQLKCDGKEFKHLAGIRTQAKIKLYVDERVMAQDEGELQLTNYGISGIPVFQVSRFASKGLLEKKRVSAMLDFMPDFTSKEFLSYMKQRYENNREKKVDEFFVGLLHKNLISTFLKKCNISPSQEIKHLSPEEFQNLCRVIKEYRVAIIGTNSFEQAQVCAGGVDTKELNPNTLESKKMKGLYFVGEIIDVDGICGGYNLTWAFASGYIAGKDATKQND